MKLTLLQMVQSILSSMSSDEVSAFSDTSESVQIANIIRDTFFNVVARAALPNQFELFQLSPLADPSRPVVMLRPDNVAKIEWMKYFNTNPLGDQFNTQFGSYHHDLNTDLQATVQWTTSSTTTNTISTGNKTFTVASGLPIQLGQTAIAQSGTNIMQGTVVLYFGTTLTLNVTSITGSGTFSSWTISSTTSFLAPPGYQYVTILPIQQFLDMTSSFNPTDTNVGQFDFTVNEQNFIFYYKNDRQPQYCCVLENLYVIFDSFDNTQDDTLQASKSQCYGQLLPVFLMQDNFIPALDDKQFRLLMNEAKSLAFYELKQQPHQKAEQEAKRQWINVEKTKSLVDRPTYFNQLPNFGRRPGTGGYPGRMGMNAARFYGGWFAG